MSETALTASLAPSVGSFSPEEWNALGGDRNPFVSHQFLTSLEDSGSVGPGTGWQPAPLVITDSDGALIAALPSYAKGHSQGEYVFDHSWAHALDTKTPLPDTAETCGAHAVPCSFRCVGAQNDTVGASVRECRDLFFVCLCLSRALILSVSSFICDGAALAGRGPRHACTSVFDLCAHDAADAHGCTGGCRRTHRRGS